MEELLDKLDREGFKPATLSKRIIAMSIDDFLVSLIVVLAFWSQFSVVRSVEDEIVLINKLFLYIFIVYTLYHWIFIALYGKTVGKMAVKIRAIDIQTFDNPSHLRAFVRSLFRNFDEIIFYLGMIYAVVDPLNRALHDIIGKTVVVED